MTAEALSASLGVVLSLVFAYVPGAKDWYGALPNDRKRLVMLGGLALVALATFGLGCTSFGAQLGVSLACSQDEALGLVRVLAAAVIANQSAYALLPSVAYRKK
jgi:hypothetical protein